MTTEAKSPTTREWFEKHPLLEKGAVAVAALGVAAVFAWLGSNNEGASPEYGQPSTTPANVYELPTNAL